MKKLLLFFVAIISVFALVACDKNVDPTFEAPQNVAVSEAGVVTWDSVTEADHYILFIDLREIIVEGTSFDLNTVSIEIGDRLISVVAVKEDNTVSLPSTVITYTVVALVEPSVISDSVLGLFDDSYVPDMDENDFEYEWEYEDYQNAVKMAEAYGEATSSIRMTEANAVGFFTAFKDMAQGMDETTTVSDLMTDLDMFDTYEMTPYATAVVLYHLVLAQMEIEMPRIQDEISYWEQQQIAWPQDEWIQERIDEYEYNYDQLEATYDAFVDNKAIIIQSIELVIDYAVTFKNSVPQNVIDLLDDAAQGEELTLAEIVLIKDEIVGILQDTLPSAEDFTILYTTLFYVGGAITGVDMSTYIPHAEFMGEVDHAMFNLVLTLLADIDQQMIEDIQGLVESINVDNGMYTQTDPEAVIDLFVYVLNYVDSFKTANQTLFDELETLGEDDSVEALYTIAIENIIAQIEADPSMDPEEQTIAVAILEDMIGEYDAIKAGLEVFEQIGVNVFEEIIDTQAAIFYTIIDMQDLMEPTPAEIAAIIEDMIDHVSGYNSAVMDVLTQANIQLLLDMVEVPVVAALENGANITTAQTLYTTLSPHVATVIANVVTLEKALVAAAGTLNMTNILDTDYNYLEIAAAAAVIKAFDIALSSTNEALFASTVNVVFDDILKNSTVVSLIPEMDVTALSQMQAMVLSEASNLFTEIHAVADFQGIATMQYGLLSTAELERVEALLSILQEMFGDGNEQPDGEYIYIEEGATMYVFYYGDDIYYVFSPETSGTYTLTSITGTSAIDPYVSLFDSNWNQIDYDDDGGMDYFDFSLTAYFEYGETYYFHVAAYESSATFMISLFENN